MFSENVLSNVEGDGRVRQATDDNIIRCTRFACRITKATGTHSLRGHNDHANALQYYVHTFIACLVNSVASSMEQSCSWEGSSKSQPVKGFLTCYAIRRFLNVYTRVGTLIVATIYLKLIQNRYMCRSFTVLHCSHQHCVQPVASDVEVVG